MTDKEYTTEFQKELNDYIKLGFNQDECSGFMHGFHKGAEAVKNLNIDECKHENLYPVTKYGDSKCFDCGKFISHKDV